jgi:hypothetical protein
VIAMVVGVTALTFWVVWHAQPASKDNNNNNKQAMLPAPAKVDKSKRSNKATPALAEAPTLKSKYPTSMGSEGPIGAHVE